MKILTKQTRSQAHPRGVPEKQGAANSARRVLKSKQTKNNGQQGVRGAIVRGTHTLGPTTMIICPKLY